MGERPDDYEKRLGLIDLEKIISLSELFMLTSLPVNEQNSTEPLKQNFLMDLQGLLDKLEWYGTSLLIFIIIIINTMNVTIPY